MHHEDYLFFYAFVKFYFYSKQNNIAHYSIAEKEIDTLFRKINLYIRVILNTQQNTL